MKHLFKQIFLSLFICSGLYAGQLQPERFFQNNGGLVDHISPLLVPNSSASALENITMDNRGQLVIRGGYDNLNSVALSTNSLTGGGYHNAASGNSFFGVVSGTNVYKTGNTFAGSYSVVTGTVTITAGASNLVQTTSANDKLIFCNELDKPFYLGSTGNAIHISTGLFTGAKTCATYGNYLVLASLTESGTAYPSRVRWSDINSNDSFPLNNYIDVEPNDGDKIVSIVTFDDSVYIFKKRSIHKMVITGLDGADAFIIRPLVRNIGAWSKNSVKVIPNVGIAFLAQNTAYILNDSGLEPIGDAIQRTFDGVTRTMWANSVAAVYPKRYQYWIAVSTSSDSQNHKVLIYDYIQKSWSVYTGMNINALAQAEDSNGNSILLSGDYSGFHYKQDIGVADNPLGVETAISASYTTAPLTFSSPEITKNFKYLYVLASADLTTTLNVKAYYDYSDTYSFNEDLDLGNIGAVYGTGVYGTDVYPAQQALVKRIELNQSARSVKLKFTNTSSTVSLGLTGWVVIYSLEDWRQ